MIIRGTTLEAVQAAVIPGVEADARLIGNSRGGGQTVNVKLDLSHDENREHYRRFAPNKKRRISAVCWHGFRDYLRALFAITPDAVVKTAVATYRGSEGFEEMYEATGRRNIGSQAFPTWYAEACECEEGAV